MARRVDVGDIHIDSGGEIAHPVFLSTDDGGHSTGGSLAGLLHRAGAFFHEAKSGFKIKSSRSGMSGEFAQREAGSGMKFQGGELFLKHREAGEPMNIQRGLAHRGFGQLLARPLKGDPAERISKDRVGFFKKRGSGGELGSEVFAHADGLGTLAGEEKCGFFHDRVVVNSKESERKSRPAEYPPED